MTTEISKASSNRRIVFLDFLRIFAFASVLAGHKFYLQSIDLLNDPSVHLTLRQIMGFLIHFIAGGGAGVVVFFLVSGYIITHVLQKEKPLDFFIKRLFRIYPLLMAAVLLEALYKYVYAGVTPDFWILVQHMLLIGDFFGTYYALSGVEWTLRVEFMFYLFMLLMKSTGLIDRFKSALPWVLVLATYALGQFAPFPDNGYWAHGYFTIYGTFLFLGAMWYLREKQQISLTFFLMYLGFVLLQHYDLIEAHQTRWLKAPFATLAVGLFFLAWHFRDSLSVTPVILLLSEMTYSVYLFHNWLWDPIKLGIVNKLSLSFVHPSIQILIVLMVFCYLTVIFVERPGIKLGARTVRYVKGRMMPTLVKA
jgi:peptidoglycan/LPS O-acetylase OafA/YrhL